MAKVIPAAVVVVSVATPAEHYNDPHKGRERM